MNNAILRKVINMKKRTKSKPFKDAATIMAEALQNHIKQFPALGPERAWANLIQSEGRCPKCSGVGGLRRYTWKDKASWHCLTCHEDFEVVQIDHLYPMPIVEEVKINDPVV